MDAAYEAALVEHFAEHRLTVLREDDLYRHWRCQQPHTWTYGFDVLTWPGYLCVCGDIGTWVFTRTRDMIEFFDSDHGRINPDYWSEKLADGPERSRITRSPSLSYESDPDYPVDNPVDAGWNAQFICACHGIVVAIRLRKELKDGST